MRAKPWPSPGLLPATFIVILAILFLLEQATRGSSMTPLSIALCSLVAIGLLYVFWMLYRETARRRQEERSLRENERTYRQIVEAATEGIWMIDANDRTTFVNGLMGSMLGYTTDELMGKTWIDFTDDQARATTLATLDSLRQRKAEQIDLTFFRKDGSKIWTLANATAILDESGAYAGALALVRDISDRKKGEERLRQSEELFRLITENAADLIAVLDMQGRRLYNSPSYATLLGNPGGAVGSDSFAEIHPEDREKIQAVFRKTTETGIGQRAEYRFRAHDGTLRYIESQGSVVRDRDGKPSRVVVVSRDVTDRKRSEEALLRTTSELEAVFSALPDLYFRLSTNGTILDYKASSFFDLYVPPAIFMGRRMQDVLPPRVGEQVSRALKHVATTRTAQRIEYSLPIQGTEKEFEARVVPLLEDQVIVVVRDITEAKQAEAQIRTSLREKETLLKEVHHRVKNNLQVVSSLLHLQSGFLQDQRDLMLFRESEDRLLTMALIHEKLYHSDTMSWINFDEYLHDLVAKLVRMYGLGRIKYLVEPHHTHVGVDVAIPCGLIVNELVTNSLKYAFPAARKGTIHVSLRKIDENIHRLTVADDGVGLPPNLDYRNTETLGLQLVMTLADQLGGTAEFRRDRGTTFVVSFPAGNGAVQAVPEK